VGGALIEVPIYAAARRLIERAQTFASLESKRLSR